MKALIKAKAKEWGVPREMAKFVLVKRARRRYDNVYDFKYEKFLNGGNGNENQGSYLCKKRSYC